jgi:tetratricopeptide (TPR) repeat protein
MKTLGAQHPLTAASLSNLASLLQAQRDFANARPLYECALAIRAQALGPHHPDTATSLNNLASLLYELGDLESARPLCVRPGDSRPGTRARAPAYNHQHDQPGSARARYG